MKGVVIQEHWSLKNGKKKDTHTHTVDGRLNSDYSAQSF